MIQNLALFLNERGPDTQLGQAEMLVKIVIQLFLGIDTHHSSNDVKDLTSKIYITGHSKAGGLTQGVVCILREEFNIKVKGVTFSATPIYLLPLQLENPSMDWECENYLLESDKVLYGLDFLRFLKLIRMVRGRLRNSNGIIKKLKLRNLIKLWCLTRKLGSSYVGGIRNILKPKYDFCHHSIHHYDKHFFPNGKLPAKKSK